MSDLIKQGANANAVCSWTGMTPLHTAAYFNSSAVLNVLVTQAKPDINATCAGFDGECGPLDPCMVSVSGQRVPLPVPLLLRGAWCRAQDTDWA